MSWDVVVMKDSLVKVGKKDGCTRGTTSRMEVPFIIWMKHEGPPFGFDHVRGEECSRCIGFDP